jgi:hypothetical protein
MAGSYGHIAPSPDGQVEMRVDELARLCEDAAKTMSTSNSHRLILFNAARAIMELAIRLEAEQRMVSNLFIAGQQLDEVDQRRDECLLKCQDWTREGLAVVLEPIERERNDAIIQVRGAVTALKLPMTGQQQPAESSKIIALN